MHLRLGIPLALGFGAALAVACRAGEGERCICGDDCKDGLACVVDGRVLESDECLAAGDPDSEPGECIDDQSGADEEDGGFAPPLYMDLGGKRDFEPGPPPVPTSGGGSSSGDGTAGTTDAGTGEATTGDTGDTGDTTAGVGTTSQTVTAGETGASTTTGAVTSTSGASTGGGSTAG